MKVLVAIIKKMIGFLNGLGFTILGLGLGANPKDLTMALLGLGTLAITFVIDVVVDVFLDDDN